jgi:hypothetical protein
MNEEEEDFFSPLSSFAAVGAMNETQTVYAVAEEEKWEEQQAQVFEEDHHPLPFQAMQMDQLEEKVEAEEKPFVMRNNNRRFLTTKKLDSRQQPQNPSNGWKNGGRIMNHPPLRSIKTEELVEEEVEAAEEKEEGDEVVEEEMEATNNYYQFVADEPDKQPRRTPMLMRIIGSDDHDHGQQHNHSAAGRYPICNIFFPNKS